MLNSLKSGNRLRVDFSKTPQKIDVPNLLQLQQNSYDTFLMLDKKGDGGRRVVAFAVFFK